MYLYNAKNLIMSSKLFNYDTPPIKKAKTLGLIRAFANVFVGLVGGFLFYSLWH